MWNHSPCCAQKSASASNWSKQPRSTEPAVPITQNGCAPWARSWATAAASCCRSIAPSPSVAMLRSAWPPRPSNSSALRTALCAPAAA